MFDRTEDMMKELADASSRVFLGAFGLGWSVFGWLIAGLIGSDRWQDPTRWYDPTLIFLMWNYLANCIAGLLVFISSFLTLRFLHGKFIGWGFIAVSVFVGFSVVLSGYLFLHLCCNPIQTEPPDLLKMIHCMRTTMCAFGVGIFAVLGIAFSIAVIRLVRRSKQAVQA